MPDKSAGTPLDLRKLPSFTGNRTDLIVSSLGLNVLAMALPLTLMQVYDRIIPTRSESTLLWLTVGFTTALFLECILRYVRSLVSNWIGARFEHMAGCGVMESLLASRLEDFESQGVGVHLDHLEAVSALRGFYSGQAAQFLLDLPFAILFLIAIAFLGGPGPALFTMGAIAAFLMAVLLCAAPYRRGRKNLIRTNDHRDNFVIETLRGIHTVKALTMEEQMLRRHERLQGETARIGLRISLLRDIPENLGTVFSQVALFGVILLGGKAVMDGTVTVGALAACTLLAGRAFAPFKGAASYLTRRSDMTLARNRIAQATGMRLDSSPDSPPLPLEISGDLTLSNVSFTYPESLAPVLADLDLHIGAGECVGIPGEASSGATTLLSLMRGLFSPTQGSVLLDGFDLAGINTRDMRGRIEYVPQTGVLFDGSIFENITMFDHALHDAATDAASLLGLDAIAARLPLGYETHVGNRLHEFLPSGVVQRIILARALTVRPRILLLDKTDQSMDRGTVDDLARILKRLKGTCTIVMVTDNPLLLRLADRILAIREGKAARVEAPPCPEMPPLDQDETANARWMRWALQTARTWNDVKGVIKTMNIKEVDEDHRIFTEYVLELNELIAAFGDANASLEEVRREKDIFKKLADYAEVHFQREEGIMREMNSPRLAGHQKEHDIFRELIRERGKEFAEGRLQVTGELKLSILDWWVRHINVIDAGTFLATSGGKETP